MSATAKKFSKSAKKKKKKAAEHRAQQEARVDLGCISFEI